MSQAGPSLGSRQGRLVLAATTAASGIAFLDGSIVNVALPHISADLGGGFATAQWVLDGYLLTLGALVLVGGGLGDLLGKRRVFETGMALFGIASVLCGLAPSAAVLIAARLLQGVAAALLAPASLAILTAVFSGAARGAAIGAWSGLSGVFTALGPFVGGALVDSGPSGWRWAFLVNPPLLILALLLSRRGVPDLPGSRTPAPLPGQLDLLGGGLTVLGLGLLVTPLIELDRWGPGVATLLVVAGVVALAGFVAVERHRESTLRPPPMIPLRLFGIRAFSVANVVTFVVYGALSVNGLMLTLLLQTELGYTALQAGAATLPVTALLAVLSSQVGALVPRLGSRSLLVGGCTVVAAAFAGMATIARDATYVGGVLPWVVLFGLGLTLVVAPVTTTVLADVSGAHAGVASGVNNAVARLGGLITVAVLPLIGGLSGGAVGGADFLAGYGRTMVAAGALCLLGAAISWFGFTARTGRVEPR